MGNAISGRRETAEALKSLEKQDKKVLFVGCSDTGKSTFFKQLNRVNNGPYNAEDRKQFKEIIFENIVRYMRVISEFIVENNVPHTCPVEVTKIANIDSETIACIQKIWTSELIEQIKTIWHSDAAQKVFVDRHKLVTWCFNGEALQHYMKHIDEMKNPNWIPTQADVIFSRVHTTGVVENILKVNNTKFYFADIGSNRRNRRWVNLLENTSCILFFASISDYAMLCYEDNETNRAIESLCTFEEIVNFNAFVGTPVVLFLNKADTLEHTMRRCHVSSAFPEYTGDNLDAEQVTHFFINKYLEQYKGQEQNKILPMLISSLDINEVKEALKTIADVTIAGNTKGHEFKMRLPRHNPVLFTMVAFSFTDMTINNN